MNVNKIKNQLQIAIDSLNKEIEKHYNGNQAEGQLKQLEKFLAFLLCRCCHILVVSDFDQNTNFLTGTSLRSHSIFIKGKGDATPIEIKTLPIETNTFVAIKKKNSFL